MVRFGMRWWRPCAVALMLMNGCTSTSRVKRHLGSVGGLIATNSPMLLDEADPERDGDRIWIDYSVIVQNDDSAPVTMRFDTASVEIDGRHRFVPCKVRDRENR